MTDLPLDGFVVLDLCTSIRGAYCTKLLADYGAVVLKLEPPGGDPIRRLGPFISERDPLETGVAHLYLDTNKQSLTLDLETASGQIILARLAAGADAAVFDSNDSVLDGWGFGAGLRQERFPKLVTTLVTPYGQWGPYADYPAANLTSFAAGGQMALTGDPDREPLKNGGEQAEYQAGLNAFAATLAGLWAAAASGVGDTIDVSAQECMASTLELAMPAFAYLGRPLMGVRRGNINSAVLGIYPCADGYIGVHAMPRNFAALARLMDAEWMLEDPDFALASGRLQHDDELRALIYGWAAGQEKHAVYARAGEIRAPVAFVHGMEDVIESPQLRHRGYFHDVEHPAAGTLTYAGAPISMGPGTWRAGRAPLLGEHTAEALRERLSLSDSDLDALRTQGVI